METMFGAQAARVLGRDHLVRESNGQDAFAVRAKEGKSVAVVADGCGSGGRSEVGAAVVAYAAARAVMAAMHGGASADLASKKAFPAVLRALARVASVAPREEREGFVNEHLLATFVLLAVDENELAIVAYGDGRALVDDELFVVDREAPAYPAYALFGHVVTPVLELTRAASSVRRAAIATDGLLPGAMASAFGHRGRGLARWLNVLAREAPLLDDATIAVVERVAGGAS